MRLRRTAVPVLAALALGACADQPSAPESARPNLARRAAGSATSGATLVVFKADAIPADFESRVAALGGRVILTVPQVGVASVRVDAAGAAALARSAGVQTVGAEPLKELRPLDLAGVGAPEPAYEPALEPFFSLQWGIRMINADDAIRAGFTGAGAKIGIIDTGIYYLHPDLAPNYLGGKNFFAPYCAADPLALPSTCDPNNPLDDNGHGSHVAGIVAAPANGVGVIGVAPDAKLIAAKVCGRTVGCPTAAMIAGMVYAADQGVDAMNISIGGFFFLGRGNPDDPQGPETAEFVALKRAANYAHSKGSLVINSSGNDGVDLDEIPGYIKRILGENGNVMVVSAVGPDTQPAYSPNAEGVPEVYTNTGHIVDVAAPGGSVPPTSAMIVSTFSPLSPDLPGALYAYSVGTSMAAPHAAGAAAQVVGAYGDVSPSRIRTIIRQTATDLGKRGNDRIYGAGLIDVARAVGLR